MPAPHPIPKVHPIPTENIQNRFKRRLQTPGSMAPTPRARQIQILSWALSIGNIKSFVHNAAKKPIYCMYLGHI
ncbi:MAG: hypothetical protein EXX96DRAFT_576781 [Benjaminiella poitrasii]|nr:MAG: hypothetical protein EXX96DRAFT_576781 [Benjaminiella poitrasii]